MGRVMIAEEIVQDIIEVLEEEVQDTNEMLTNPTTEEICNAIDTHVNFSMFTESSEIGTIAMKASTLFEKELCKSMKQDIYIYIYIYIHMIINVILYVNYLTLLFNILTGPILKSKGMHVIFQNKSKGQKNV